MLHRPGTHRPGVTLLEVLTAIFIMGIGMLALLTLFPVGALSMARAVRDDRAATIAANASSLAVAFDLRHDPAVVNNTTMPEPTNPNGPGHPVFIDPHYALAPINSNQLGGQIARVAPTFANTTARAIQYFTFQDEIEFHPYGHAKGALPGCNRPGTYSMAYLMRRPKHISPELVELSVVVYSQRPTDVQDGETTFTVTGNKGESAITLAYTGTAPNIRRRQWLIDTSNPTGFIHGYFYRIETVNDTGASLVLDLDRQLKENVTRVVHLRDAIAVVERGTTWLP